jgi:drug/metabolite transporter (DMT)-like permease
MDPVKVEGSEGRPAMWMFVVAFAAVYIAYGFNYLFIELGVKTLPPLLFAGSHITLAGLILFVYLLVRRQPCRLPWPNLGWAAAGGIIVFVGGTGLVSAAEGLGVPSGLTAVLRSTVPLWIGVLEWARPGGERLRPAAWLGLLLAGVGIAVLLVPRLEASPRDLWQHPGLFLVFGSAFFWAVGSLVLRHHRPCPSPVVAAAYQMTIGGFCLLLAGVVMGEVGDLKREEFTGRAIFGFVSLLFWHSLVAFVALNWLLKHVSAALATTDHYVSPAIAVLAGHFLEQEIVTPLMVLGIALILAGVAVAMLTQPVPRPRPLARTATFPGFAGEPAHEQPSPKK